MATLPKSFDADWDTLHQLRSRDPFNRPWQNALAPLEHRAFAKEFVQRNPKTGPLTMGVSIPLYAGMKYLQSRFGKRQWSDPAWPQVTQGYKGILDGLK